MEISGVNIHITIGDLEVYRAPHWWIESLRHYPLGRAGVTLPDPTGELYQNIQYGDPVTISLGYRNEAPVIWNGTVTVRFPGQTSDQLEIRAIDGSRPLASTRILQSWENETPEALIAWAIRQAGLPVGKIGATGVILPRVVASDVSVWQLIRQVKHSCQTGFNLDLSKWALWLGRDGVNFGDYDEPGDTVQIATSENLIDHQPNDFYSGMSKIEAYLLAGLSHSRTVRLIDDKRGINSLHRVQRVRHEGAPDRVRTFVWYGAEHG